MRAGPVHLAVSGVRLVQRHLAHIASPSTAPTLGLQGQHGASRPLVSARDQIMCSVKWKTLYTLSGIQIRCTMLQKNL